MDPLASPPTIDPAGLSPGTRHDLRKRASTYDEVLRAPPGMPIGVPGA